MTAFELPEYLGFDLAVPQAVGMVSVLIGGSLEEAEMRLMTAAAARCCSVKHLSHEVVERRVRFAPDGR